MKKKKAAMLARKLEAEKQLAAKKSSTTDSDDKSSKEEKSDKSSSAVEVVDVDKSEEKTLSPKQPLASVPETTEAKDAPTTDAPKMTFGSSSTTLPPSTFGSMPKPPTMQSEPDCPKPTFGSSSGFGSGVAPPTFGSASTTTFGGGAASKPSTTGFGVATSAKPADESSPKGSGAFLNLTPPKTGNTPGKFVFGSGAPITLAAPSTTSMDAAQTLASFGQPAKFGTGFGTSSGGFGSAKPAFGSSPFGGGAGDASKKRPLDSATDEKGEEDDSQPDAKKVHTEEEEKEADADKSSKDEAAKEA